MKAASKSTTSTSISTPSGTTIRTAAPPDHAVRNIVIPLNVDGNESSLFPVVDRDRMPEHVYRMLADTAGIGDAAITGDKLTAMPQIEEVSDNTAFPFGRGAHRLHAVRQPRFRP